MTTYLDRRVLQIELKVSSWHFLNQLYLKPNDKYCIGQKRAMWGSRQRTERSFHEVTATWSHSPAGNRRVLPGASRGDMTLPREIQILSAFPRKLGTKEEGLAGAHMGIREQMGIWTQHKVLDLLYCLHSVMGLLNTLDARDVALNKSLSFTWIEAYWNEWMGIDAPRGWRICLRFYSCQS